MYFISIRYMGKVGNVPIEILTDHDNLEDFICLLEGAKDVHSYTVSTPNAVMEPNSFGKLGGCHKWKLLLFEPEPVEILKPWRTPEEIKEMSEAFYTTFPGAPGSPDVLVNAKISIDSIPGNSAELERAG